jgi:hypothetical protein
MNLSIPATDQAIAQHPWVTSARDPVTGDPLSRWCPLCGAVHRVETCLIEFPLATGEEEQKDGKVG